MAKDIKKKFGGKNYKNKTSSQLHDFLDREILDLINEFFKIPEIQNYLTRSVMHVNFTGENHPKFNVNNKAQYYEQLIYARLPELILYRDEAFHTSKYYLSGTHPSHNHTIQQWLQSLVKISDDIEVWPPMDTYEIKETMEARQLKWKSQQASKARFVLTPNWKDKHATCCLHIIEPKTQKTLVTLFINSWRQKEYTSQMERIFLRTPTNWYSPSTDEDSEYSQLENYLIKTFELDKNIISLNHYISLNDEEEKACCKIYFEKENLEHRNEPVNKDLISTIYEVEVNKKTKKVDSIYVTHDAEFSFIDASHDIQNKGDHNCAIYSMSFIKAIIAMLSSEKAEIIYELAEKSGENEIMESLTKIFTEDIKKYLPEYYDRKGDVKPQEILHQYHREARWNLGNLFFSSEYPIEHSLKNKHSFFQHREKDRGLEDLKINSMKQNLCNEKLL